MSGGNDYNVINAVRAEITGTYMPHSGGSFDMRRGGIVRAYRVPGIHSESQKVPVVSNIYLARFRNDAQNLFVPGDFLFVNEPARSIQERSVKHACATVWLVNSLLEEGYIYKRYAEGSGSRKRRYSDGLGLFTDDREGMYCAGVQEFAQKWAPLGPVNTMLNENTDTEKVFTIVQGFAARMPNVWGDVKPGTRVGFMVKEIQNPYEYRVGPLGDNIGDRTPGAILQIVPYAEKTRKHPPMFSTPGAPAPCDLGFYAEETAVGQKAYSVHTAYDSDGNYPGKIIPESGVSTSTPTKAVTLQGGIYIPVGTVSEVNNVDPPDPERVKMAMRSHAVWKDLNKTHPLEIMVS